MKGRDSITLPPIHIFLLGGELPLQSLGPLQNTDLRFRISQIDGAPDIIGPVVSLLLAVEALWQQVGSTPSLSRITSLDHAGLIDFRARFVEGDSREIGRAHV